MDYRKQEIFTEPNTEYFSRPGHSIHDLRGVAVVKVISPYPIAMDASQKFIIRKLNTFQKGLSREPEFRHCWLIKKYSY